MPDEPKQSRVAAVWQGIYALVVTGGVLFLLGLGFDHFVMPKRAPVYFHPSALDTLIDSRLAIGLIRLVGIAVAVYLVASLAVMVIDGRWAIGFGPLATEHRKRADREELQAQLKEAEERVEAVEREYAEFVELVKKAVEDVPDSGQSDAGGGPRR